MIKGSSSKRYDLEERTRNFAIRARNFVNQLPKNIPNVEYGRQLIRSSGSIGANYIEASESLSKKDFVMRIKISRKETKESEHWLALAEPSEGQLKERDELVQETVELRKIFGAIIEKCIV